MYIYGISKIQTNATDQFSDGYEKEYIAYNFVGQPVKRKHVHYKSSKYGTSYAYDKNGNMTSLQRYGHTNSSSYGLIDNLTITYNGNQLKKVEDAASVPSISPGYEADFRNRSNSTTAYTFDANGNLKTDLNKGISSNITYNSINLPRSLTISNTSGSPTNTYTYTADGRLITAARGSATTQYAGHMIYEGTTLKRILVDGGYIEGSTYYYYLTDHLGNNRVVANASGKEFDKERSLNWSDFEARQYMNDVPRFTTMDPLAEKYYAYSPYAYCMGNPIKFVDPDGREIRGITKQDAQIFRTSGHEVFGHGIPAARKMTPAANNANAIHTDNLIRRILRLPPNNGSTHGGYQQGHITTPYALPILR